MPYIHWDTSRKHEQFTSEIEDIMGAAREKSLTAQETGRKTRQDARQNLHRPTAPEKSQVQNKFQKHQAKILTMRRLLRTLEEKKKINSQLEMDNNGRVRVKNRLGQFLLDAARLYEGISNYRDKKLLRIHLAADPPLHPRRTLDQAYHWILNSTRERDRDQVVYRDTTAKSEDFHKYTPPAPESNDPGVWAKHEIFGIGDVCPECKMNIQKLSRVVMVDQLWMWILDAKTIITCFPKRYGTNKQDVSAIHKSIRLRIQEGGPDQVRTVFDLGLIIIDECTNTFFDQTRTVEPQPQVMDAFSKAIGNIVSSTT